MRLRQGQKPSPAHQLEEVALAETDGGENSVQICTNSWLLLLIFFWHYLLVFLLGRCPSPSFIRSLRLMGARDTRGPGEISVAETGLFADRGVRVAASLCVFAR